jgi:hypothetical protein
MPQIVLQPLNQLFRAALLFDPPHEAPREQDVGRDIEVNRQIDEARHLAAQLPERPDESPHAPLA